ncbi:hypothetical protein COOONC_26163, partial [Cooperia oncophora]
IVNKESHKRKHQKDVCTGKFFQGRDVVTGAACRLTVLPDIGTNRTKLAFVSPLLAVKISSYSLATRLQEIGVNRYRDGWNLTDHLLEYEGMEEKSRPIDIHMWFDSVGAASEACPRGNALVVTARCAPSKKEPEIRLPHTCPDGTCDGCLFHAIVESFRHVLFVDLATTK